LAERFRALLYLACERSILALSGDFSMVFLDFKPTFSELSFNSLVEGVHSKRLAAYYQAMAGGQSLPPESGCKNADFLNPLGS